MLKGSLRTNVKTILSHIPKDFGGGCSDEKAYVLAFLIRNYDLKITVDIGVYRGRSLFPQAIAHQYYTGGTVYGVDPWHKEYAREQDTNLKEKIDQWANQTDFETIYQDVNTLRAEYNLEPHCVLIRQSSQEAILLFEENELILDLVHIDGNHDTKIVMQDIDLYIPKLRKQGIVVLDDISWPSVQPAYEILKSQMSLIYEQRNKRYDDYAIFWNDKSRLGSFQRKLVLELAALLP